MTYIKHPTSTSSSKFAIPLHLEGQHHLLVHPAGHDPRRGWWCPVVKLDLSIPKAYSQHWLLHSCLTVRTGPQT